MSSNATNLMSVYLTIQVNKSDIENSNISTQYVKTSENDIRDNNTNNTLQHTKTFHDKYFGYENNEKIVEYCHKRYCGYNDTLINEIIDTGKIKYFQVYGKNNPKRYNQIQENSAYDFLDSHELAKILNEEYNDKKSKKVTIPEVNIKKLQENSRFFIQEYKMFKKDISEDKICCTFVYLIHTKWNQNYSEIMNEIFDDCKDLVKSYFMTDMNEKIKITTLNYNNKTFHNQNVYSDFKENILYKNVYANLKESNLINRLVFDQTIFEINENKILIEGEQNNSFDISNMYSDIKQTFTYMIVFLLLKEALISQINTDIVNKFDSTRQKKLKSDQIIKQINKNSDIINYHTFSKNIYYHTIFDYTNLLFDDEIMSNFKENKNTFFENVKHEHSKTINWWGGAFGLITTVVAIISLNSYIVGWNTSKKWWFTNVTTWKTWKEILVNDFLLLLIVALIIWGIMFIFSKIWNKISK